MATRKFHVILDGKRRGVFRRLSAAYTFFLPLHILPPWTIPLGLSLYVTKTELKIREESELSSPYFSLRAGLFFSRARRKQNDYATKDFYFAYVFNTLKVTTCHKSFWGRGQVTNQGLRSKFATLAAKLICYRTCLQVHFFSKSPHIVPLCSTNQNLNLSNSLVIV